MTSTGMGGRKTSMTPGAPPVEFSSDEETDVSDVQLMLQPAPKHWAAGAVSNQHETLTFAVRFIGSDDFEFREDEHRQPSLVDIQRAYQLLVADPRERYASERCTMSLHEQYVSVTANAARKGQPPQRTELMNHELRNIISITNFNTALILIVADDSRMNHTCFAFIFKSLAAATKAKEQLVLRSMVQTAQAASNDDYYVVKPDSPAVNIGGEYLDAAFVAGSPKTNGYLNVSTAVDRGSVNMEWDGGVPGTGRTTPTGSVTGGYLQVEPQRMSISSAPMGEWDETTSALTSFGGQQTDGSRRQVAFAEKTDGDVEEDEEVSDSVERERKTTVRRGTSWGSKNKVAPMESFPEGPADDDELLGEDGGQQLVRTAGSVSRPVSGYSGTSVSQLFVPAQQENPTDALAFLDDDDMLAGGSLAAMAASTAAAAGEADRGGYTLDAAVGALPPHMVVTEDDDDALLATDAPMRSYSASTARPTSAQLRAIEQTLAEPNADRRWTGKTTTPARHAEETTNAGSSAAGAVPAGMAGPPILTALYDFQGEPNTDELSFKAGASILLLTKEKVGDGWWKGIHDGVTGVFPCAYVKEPPAAAAAAAPVAAVAVKVAPKATALTVTTLYDFESGGPDELSFKAGEPIEVLTKEGCGEGWWKGILHGVTGVFPAAYVK